MAAEASRLRGRWTFKTGQRVGSTVYRAEMVLFHEGSQLGGHTVGTADGVRAKRTWRLRANLYRTRFLGHTFALRGVT